ncbi:hypothetical protein DERF_004137 [Dermatophagoides farinae]|uniref:Uncharacterized protein n=1 Tax=Dermatophagoides farinae TaxID=6954 RepID=A0A922IGM4_DERFA|nr:hypothetical protein DERF_004137 [Dermatophagoides farinae]
MITLLMIIINTGIGHGQQRSSTTSTTKNFKCNRTKFEDDFDRLMVVSHPKRTFPENQDELKKFCLESKEIFFSLNQYKDQCSRETLKNFVSIILYSVRGSTKRVCTKRKSPQTVALIDASNCINRNKRLIGRCMDRASLNYAAIKFVDNVMKMPNLCCQFVEIIQCFTQVMTKNGCEDKLPVLLETITGVVGNFLDSTCGEYNLDTDKCEKLAPLPVKNLKPHSKNFVTNLVDIFKTV